VAVIRTKNETELRVIRTAKPKKPTKKKKRDTNTGEKGSGRRRGARKTLPLQIRTAKKKIKTFSSSEGIKANRLKKSSKDPAKSRDRSAEKGAGEIRKNERKKGSVPTYNGTEKQPEKKKKLKGRTRKKLQRS